MIWMKRTKTNKQESENSVHKTYKVYYSFDYTWYQITCGIDICLSWKSYIFQIKSNTIIFCAIAKIHFNNLNNFSWTWHDDTLLNSIWSGIILCMHSSNERQHYIVNIICKWLSLYPEWSLLVHDWHNAIFDIGFNHGLPCYVKKNGPRDLGRDKPRL